ncbi:hypothetical protein AMTRI_Chr05g59330 [Amborella trichopoda]
MVPNSDLLLIALIHLSSILCVILVCGFLLLIGTSLSALFTFLFIIFAGIYNMVSSHSWLIQEMKSSLKWASWSLVEFTVRLMVEAYLVIVLWYKSCVSKLESWRRTVILPAIQRVHQRFQTIVE